MVTNEINWKDLLYDIHYDFTFGSYWWKTLLGVVMDAGCNSVLSITSDKAILCVPAGGGGCFSLISISKLQDEKVLKLFAFPTRSWKPMYNLQT